MKRNPKRVMRTVVSLVLSLMMVLGMATTAFASSTYTVTKGDIADKAVELYDAVKSYAADDEEAAKVLADIEAAVADMDLEQAKADLEAFLNEQGTTTDAVIDELVAQINALNEYLYVLYETHPEEVAAIEASIDYLNALLEEAVAEQEALFAAGEKALAAIDKMIEIAATNSDEDLAPYIQDIKDAIADVDAAMETVVLDLDAINATIDEAVAVAAEIIAETEALIAEVKAEIEAAVEEIDAAVQEAIAKIEATLDAIDAAIAEFNAAVEALIAEIQAIVEETIAQIEAAIEEAIAYVEARIEAATTCDYEINKDSYYLAIGDYVAEEYAVILAEELGIEAGALDVEAADLLDAIAENKSEIEKADLITVGYSNAEIIELALAQIADPADLDWGKFVGTEYEAYVDEAIAYVEAELAKNGIEGEAADILIDAVEGYAYAYTAVLCSYPEAVNAIKAINPEAQVIIVGMHNPLAGLVVDVEGTEVAVGDYVDYIIAASNAHYFGYALLTGNAIYVDAPDVAIGLDASKVYELEELAGLLTDDEAFYPTAEGNAYIAEQILNAMNVTVAEEGILGDADMNGEVDFFDAQLILDYYVGNVEAADIDLSVSDVDASGEVDMFDAQMILEYYAGNIDGFPAEQ